MKNNLKRLLSIVLSIACILATTPVLGFAAENKTLFLNGSSVTDSDGNAISEPTATKGDIIQKQEAAAEGYFTVYINGEKDSVAEHYDGANSLPSYTNPEDESTSSGNIYYDKYAVPAAPEGFKEGATVSAVSVDGEKLSGGYSPVRINLDYSPIEYTVKYDLNGGTGSVADSVVKYSTEFTVASIGDATNGELVFTGWNTKADGSGTSYAAGSVAKNLTTFDGENITLYAQWKAGETVSTITFDSNGGSETAPITQEIGSEFTAPKNPEKEGHTFKGWEPELPEKMPAESLTVTAKWEINEYKVTYYLTESETYGETQTYKFGEKIIPPTAPLKEGYDFSGWILGKTAKANEEFIKMPETMPAKDLKVYASWELKEINISYVSDGTEIAKNSALYGSDISITIPSNPVKDGYVFAGWFDSEGNNVYSYKTVPANDVSFTAKWLKNGNVTYMVDDKTYEAYEVKEGDKIPVPENPEKFAKKFVGWDPEIPETMPAEDLVFTAKFETDKEFVTLVIGGTLIAGGVIAGLGAAAITGISIIGGIIAIIGISSVVGNINKSYTVTYKVDGKVYKTYNVSAGEKIPVPEKPSKSGYNFVGWSPEIPNKMPKKDLTFEAEFSAIDSNLPSTGSAAIGVAALATLAVSAAAAIIFAKKKKED